MNSVNFWLICVFAENNETNELYSIYGAKHRLCLNPFFQMI